MRIQRRHAPLLYAVVLAYIAWAGLFWQLHTDHQGSLRLADRDASTLAQTYAEHVRLFTKGMDRTMLFVRTLWRQDASDVDLSGATKAGNYLADLPGQLLLLDRTGKVLTATPGPVPRGSTLADFATLQDSHGCKPDSLLISRPGFDPAFNHQIVFLSRCLEEPDGSSNGRLCIALDPDVLTGAATIGAPSAVAASIRLVEQDDPVDPPLGGPSWPTWDEATPTVQVQQALAPGLAVSVSVRSRTATDLYRSERLSALAIGAGLTVLFVVLLVLFSHEAELLAGSLGRHVATIDGMPHGVIMTNAYRRVTIMNRRAVELLGLPRSLSGVDVAWDAIDRWVADQRLSTSGLMPDTCLHPAAHARDGNPACSCGDVQTLDERMLQVVSTALADGCIVRTLTDLTETRQIRSKRDDAGATLETASHDRAVFLAMMSHEISTPMNDVLGTASVLLTTQLTGEQIRLTRAIEQSADDLLKIVEGLVITPRPGADGFDPSVIDLLIMEIGVTDAVSIVDIFLSDVPKRLRELRSVAAQAHPKAAIRIFHSLKSAAGSLGCIALSQCCIDLEADIKGADQPALTTACERLEESFEQARSALASWRGTALAKCKDASLVCGMA